MADIEPITPRPIAATHRYGMEDILAPGERPGLADLPRLRIPAGGGTTWELPTGEAVKALDVIIVHRQLTRAYWPTAFDGGSEPPACASDDAVTGIGDPGGSCATCPYAQFGSSGRGQACRLITRLFITRAPGQFPMLLALPPSAAAIARQYIVNTLIATGLPYWGLRTTIALRRIQSAGGVTYSVPEFSAGQALDPDELAEVEAMRSALIPALSTLRAGTDAV
jgi:hypothetical protein